MGDQSMARLGVFCCAVVFSGCATMGVLAREPMIDVRTGLWEMSSERSSEGMPQMPAASQIPPEVLAAMPPEQRARLREAMQAARGGSKKARVSKVCVTRQAIERGLAFGSELRPSCTHNVRARSKNKWELQATCNEGGRRQTIDVSYEAPTPVTINGSVDIVMTDGKRRMAMKQVMRGRWLGPDCGDVKPKE
jgi:hypothetical protein